MALKDISAFKASNTVMVQGCTSDAGKSVMVAGLCRLLARQQHKVAPFKPQNMALNSAVTPDGGEIGRAQALQAIAAGVELSTDFNPILLKPSSDKSSQVIIHGKALDTMNAVTYHDYKKVAMQAVLSSHTRLRSQYDKIVVEGAGSPAEINLRKGDVANMGFAEAVDCPVVLIADIDRGGVFAHLVGTLELLSQSEQDRVVGFIINRFRGDIKLLEPGLEWLEKRTNKPVLGVIPYLKNLFLDAEDAINIEQEYSPSALTVVVPVLPRISNHTDFDALRLHPEINLKFVSVEEADRTGDLIILPGSKNVIHDLNTLMLNGWQHTLNKHLRYGGKVLGICGGYQMLGQSISDPTGIENNGKAQHCDGFGLIDITTELQASKELRNVSAVFEHNDFKSAPNSTSNPITISGYEIHCGQSTLGSQAIPLLRLNNGNIDGCLSDDGQVMGTYLHGLFDTPAACNELLRWAGVSNESAISLEDVREQQIERLADCLEQHLRPDFLAQLSQPSQLSHLSKTNADPTAPSATATLHKKEAT